MVLTGWSTSAGDDRSMLPPLQSHKFETESVQDMSKSRDQLNEYLRKINIEGKRVFDVGVQDKPTGRLTRGEAKEYLTSDIDPQWNPDFVFDLNIPNVAMPAMHTSDPIDRDEVGIFDGDDIKTVKRADVVFCIEVLEHCWNPVAATKNIANLLTDGGVAYISTPFINPHHDTHDYLRYTNEWFRDVLPKVGFSEVEIFERVATDGKGLLAAFFKTEGLRVSKIRPEFGRYTFPIGYIVKATK